MQSAKSLAKALKGVNKTSGSGNKTKKMNKFVTQVGDHIMTAFKAEEAKKKQAVAKRKASAKTTKIVEDPKAMVYTDGACSGNGKSSAKGGLGIFWRWSCLDESLSDKDDVLEAMSFEEAQSELFEYFGQEPDPRWKDNITNQRCEAMAITLALTRIHELHFWKTDENDKDSTREDARSGALRNYVFYKERDVLNEREADQKKQHAMHNAPIALVKICSDSEWAINCITTWPEYWIKAAKESNREDWHNGKGQPVIHQDLHKISYALMEDLTNDEFFVRLEHVKGHSGIYGNMMTDALARLGSEQCTQESFKNEISRLKRGLEEREKQGSDEQPMSITGASRTFTLGSILDEVKEEQMQ